MLFRSAPQTEGTLVMIGDPKQAIYSFRGADVQTYLQARTDCLALDANSRHSLLQNRRSTPALLATLNGLFAHHPALFGTGIDFSPAFPTEPQEGTPQAATPPVQVVVSEGWGDAQAQDHRDFLLSHMITDMVRQLDNGQAQPQDLEIGRAHV